MDVTTVLQMDQNIKLTEFLAQLADQMQQHGSGRVDFDIPGYRQRGDQREFHVMSFSVRMTRTN